MALNWFISYLSNRSFLVKLRDASSSCAPFSCGVPKGSILCVLLFTITLPLGHILHSLNINFQCCADDTQLYVQLKSGSTDVLHVLSCLTEAKNWMSQNILQLNDSKLEVIIITTPGPSTSSAKYLSSSLGSDLKNVCKEASNLTVFFDSQ